MKSFKTEKGTELPILNLKGKDYLEVKYRLVWFREERPEWGIETELVTVTDKYALAKATIKDPQGRIRAMAHKREDVAHFADNIEKAETSSVGRALALCGYGTQFCADELDEGDRLADAPVDRNARNKVGPEQPPEDDGVSPQEYKIDFGQWKGRSIEQVYRDHGATGKGSIGSYIQYLEDQAIKENRPLTDKASELIKRASAYIAEMENVPLDNSSVPF